MFFGEKKMLCHHFFQCWLKSVFHGNIGSENLYCVYFQTKDGQSFVITMYSPLKNR